MKTTPHIVFPSQHKNILFKKVFPIPHTTQTPHQTKNKRLQGFSPKVFVEVFISISRTRRDCPKKALRVIPSRAKRVRGGFSSLPPKIWVFLGFLDNFLWGRQPNTPFSMEFMGGTGNPPLTMPKGSPNSQEIRIIDSKGPYIYPHK